MFENDHIVDFPDLMPSGMTTPDIVEAGIPVRSQTPMRAPSPGAAVGTVDAVLDINLTEIFIAYQFDIEQQQIEVDEVTRVILRHMTQIKQIYKFYSSLGTLETPDNTFVMSRMQFWRFLKDCGLHTFGFTLVDLDSADGISETKEDIHDPSTKIYVRDFVNGLIHIAYMIFKEDDEAEESFVSSSLLKMITENVLPNACTVKGKGCYSLAELKFMSSNPNLLSAQGCKDTPMRLDIYLASLDFVFFLVPSQLVSVAQPSFAVSVWFQNC